jgi:hypothetical protein
MSSAGSAESKKQEYRTRVRFVFVQNVAWGRPRGFRSSFYEKDFGSKTLAEFREMELFNPDKSWTLVPAQDE